MRPVIHPSVMTAIPQHDKSSSAPSSSPHPLFRQQGLEPIASAAGLCTIFVAVLVLTGWVIAEPSPTEALLAVYVMSPSAAGAFVLAGLGILLAVPRVGGSPRLEASDSWGLSCPYSAPFHSSLYLEDLPYLDTIC